MEDNVNKIRKAIASVLRTGYRRYKEWNQREMLTMQIVSRWQKLHTSPYCIVEAGRYFVNLIPTEWLHVRFTVSCEQWLKSEI